MVFLNTLNDFLPRLSHPLCDSPEIEEVWRFYVTTRVTAARTANRM